MSKRAKEKAERIANGIMISVQGKTGRVVYNTKEKSFTHYELMCAAQKGYEQAEKDLAEDFHADTLIGDKDYAVFHADVEDLNGDLYNYCQEQGFMGEVKVIIVEDPGAVEIS